ncbi:MAG: excinuclease ABC subunit C [Flavobacteriales bacterium]|jgi:excinuclease ABC subunit C
MSSDKSVFDSKTFLENLTKQPGVYQMYNSDGVILYVGKAKNLKNRVASYFRNTGLTPKTQALVKRIANIQVTITLSEAEALVLEHNLIKEQKPPYNISMRDDKSYPYIFASQGESYPKISLHRGAKRKKGQYFGPYPNASAVRESLSFLQKTFKVRQCEESTYKNRSRPCLLFQIDRCSAPCVEAISKEDYEEDLRQTTLFLSGKAEVLQNHITSRMQEASGELDFEKAAIYRDRLANLRKVQAQHSIESGENDSDVLACDMNSGLICVHVIYVRTGRIIGSRSYFPNDKLAEDSAAVLGAFIGQKYLRKHGMEIPPLIITSDKIDAEDSMSEAVSLQAERKVKISSNVRTYKAQWITMALQAARQNLLQRVHNRNTVADRWRQLQDEMGLEESPKRIECFDISHTSGERAVASCVVFDENGARKSDYRLFKIENIIAGDDYAAMRQALHRRYSRLQKESKTLPDILFVDGGKGQLTQAIDVMAELGIQEIEIVGIAKGPSRRAGLEQLISTDGQVRDLNADNPALHLIQQIRDEAHRFAVAGHTASRDKARRRSTLEDIPGVGAKRRRALLTYFGGMQEVKAAAQAEIEKVPGISKKMAEDVYMTLHSE